MLHNFFIGACMYLIGALVEWLASDGPETAPFRTFHFFMGMVLVICTINLIQRGW